MEEITFLAPAMVRALLVPVAEFDQTKFRNVVEVLKRVKDVRALDLVHSPGKFNPQAYPQGHVYYNFITRDDDADSLFLHDFEPFRKTAVVIGLLGWSKEVTEEIIRLKKNQLQRKYPAPIANIIMIFGCPIAFESKISDVFCVDENLSNIETRICDATSRFLCKFSVYASAYEHTTLRSPGNLTGVVLKQRKRLSSSFEMNPERSKQMVTRGRRLKLNANFYLMAGNLKASLNDFSEAIFNLKAANDYLWLASALDGLAVCIFLLSSLGVPYRLPQFLNSLINSGKNVKSMLRSPSTTPRPSFQLSDISTSFSSFNESDGELNVMPFDVVEETIINCGHLSSYYYEYAKTEQTENVPAIVSSESLIRYALLMVLVDLNGKYDMSLVNEIVQGKSLHEGRYISENFNMEFFNFICFHVLNTDFEKLPVNSQLRIYQTLAFLFSKAKMKMKKALMVYNFLELINASEQQLFSSISGYERLDLMLRDFCETYDIFIDRPEDIIRPNYIQKDLLLHILKLCERVGYRGGYVIYGLFILTNFKQILGSSQQVEIYDKIKRFSSFVKVGARCWNDDFLVGIDFEAVSGKLVEGEESTVKIHIRNPYAFELDIKELSLSTKDNFSFKLLSPDKKSINDFKDSYKIVLKPYSEILVSLSIIPENNGTFAVDGIIASIGICDKRKYSVRVEDMSAFPPKLKKSVHCCETETKFREWRIQVVHKQPLLKIVEVKLRDKWLMLLDGERKQFSVILKNTTTSDINHLVSMFRDSTTDILNAELNNKALRPNEIYEIEYQIYKKKPFKILNKNDLVKIKGNQTFKLDLEIVGKLDVKEANLVLEYSYQKNTIAEYIRSLSIPVSLTVYPSVELAGCDIIPLTSNTSIGDMESKTCWQFLKEVSEEHHNLADFCLIALDFVNMWSEEMEIVIQYRMDGSSGAKEPRMFITSEQLQTRKNVRMFVPIKRMDLDEQLLEQKIPSLRNKQFVVDKKTPLAEQHFIKHSFWYKEEILKHLSAIWKVSSSVSSSMYLGRSGEINMRGFRFSSRMIENIRVEKVKLKLKLLNDQDIVQDLNNVYLNQFYTVRIEITNRNKYPIFGMLRHIPVCKDPPYTYEKKVLINGVLQFSIGKPLDSNETMIFELGIVFIEKGDYEWGALFDEMPDWKDGNLTIKKQHLQREQLKFKVQ